MKKYWPHLIVSGVLVVIAAFGWHNGLRNTFADARFAASSKPASGQIVVVAIDSPSIEKVGVWPWPRRLHAELLKQLDRAGTADVVLDIDFSSPADPDSDRLFVDTLKAIGGSVVLPSFKQPGPHQSTFINRPLQAFRSESWSAVVNVPIDTDGLVRRYPLGERLDDGFVPSMGAVLAGVFNEKDAPFLIDFGIQPSSIPMISYFDVLKGDQKTLESLRGKKVIVGGTALELGDRFSAPNGRVLAGPIVQALAAESLLQGRALYWTSPAVTIVGFGILCSVMLLLWPRLSGAKKALALVLASLLVEGAAFVVQIHLPIVVDTSLLQIAIASYLVIIVLREIEILSLLGRIAESRFHRVALSLGDGLICLDQNHIIRFWNPSAASIFGYDAHDAVNRPLSLICAETSDQAVPSSLMGLSAAPSGVVVEFEGRRQNGDVFPAEASFSVWQGAEGPQYGIVVRDISDRKREAERIRYLAEHDTLTSLWNRYSFESRLGNIISLTQNSKVGLLIVGLDEFQRINDLVGHSTGDHIVRCVAQRLSEVVADHGGLLARLSNDEFAIAIDDHDAESAAQRLASEIEHAFEQPVSSSGRSYRVRLSTGISLYPDHGEHCDDILANAHLALTRAKHHRGGFHVIFESGIRRELEERIALETELLSAVDRNEFELFYQPQVRLSDGILSGAEALIRWNHPERGLIQPGAFMPVANTSAVSEKIAQWILETACRQSRAWELAGHRVRMGVNLSPSQLRTGDLAKSVSDIIEETGLTPSLLKLEVTEDIVLADEAKALETFRRIQQLGARIVFDDFGTGFASLSYLKKFPLNGLKIDRSFVANLQSDTSDSAIVNATMWLSKQLGLSVIAEGVEDKITADLLAAMGCPEGQGYFFGKPLPANVFAEKFLRNRESLTNVA